MKRLFRYLVDNWHNHGEDDPGFDTRKAALVVFIAVLVGGYGLLELIRSGY